MATSISQHRDDDTLSPASSNCGLDDGNPLVEFYITCNPPLRPGGVAYVLEQVKQNKIPFVEILYEPTVPWFQCTANVGRDKSLKHFMNKLILDLVDRETEGGFDVDPRTGDIKICAKNPMVLSWPQFKDLGTRELEAYELFRYPSIFQPFPFKAVWDKLRGEDLEGMTRASQILQREGDANWSLGTFRKLVGCEITYSTKEDVIYIGAKEQSSIDKAMQKLDTLLKYHSLGMFTATSLIIPPNPPVPFRLDFRTVAGFGLAQATIVRTTASGAKSAYRQLYNKGLVVTYRIQDVSRSEWTTARGPLANKASEAIDKTKLFSVFANFSYLPGGGFEKSLNVVNGHTAEVHLPQSIGRNKATSIINWVQNVEPTLSAVASPPGILDSDYPSVGLVDTSTTHESAEMRGQSTLTSRHHRKRDRKPLDLLSDDNIPLAVPAFTDTWKPTHAVSSFGDRVGGLRSALNAAAVSAPSSRGAKLLSQGDAATPATKVKPNIVKPSSLKKSAIDDLAGLSILPSKDDQALNNAASARTSGLYDQAGSQKDQASQPPRAAALSGNKVTPGVVDLLGLVFEEGQLELMAPLVPGPVAPGDAPPEALLGEDLPPRQYFRTMNQKAGRKGKAKEVNRDSIPAGTSSGFAYPGAQPNIFAEGSHGETTEQPNLIGNGRQSRDDNEALTREEPSKKLQGSKQWFDTVNTMVRFAAALGAGNLAMLELDATSSSFQNLVFTSFVCNLLIMGIGGTMIARYPMGQSPLGEAWEAFWRQSLSWLWLVVVLCTYGAAVVQWTTEKDVAIRVVAGIAIGVSLAIYLREPFAWLLDLVQGRRAHR